MKVTDQRQESRSFRTGTNAIIKPIYKQMENNTLALPADP
jgi:hypothetical protein